RIECALTDVVTSVLGGTRNRKRCSVGRVSAVPVPGRGVLSLWSFLFFPQESTTCRFNHYCLSVKSNFHCLLQYFGFIFQTSIYEIDSQILIKDVFESLKIRDRKSTRLNSSHV